MSVFAAVSTNLPPPPSTNWTNSRSETKKARARWSNNNNQSDGDYASCVYVFTQLAGDSPDWAQILRKVFFGIFGAFWSSRLHGKCIVKLVSSQTTIVEPTMIWSNDRVICNDDDDAAVCGVCVCVFVKVCQFPKCEKICCANIFIANARLIIANNFLFSIILWCCCCF